MSSLQLKTFFSLSKEQRDSLPPVLLETLLNKSATVIQRGWRSTWIYKKNTIVDVFNTSFTSHFCQKYMFEEIFNREVTIENLFYFLHEFFKHREENYLTEPSTLQRLMSIITREAKEDAHNIFCILYGIIQAPDRVNVTFKMFREIFSLFPVEINNEMLRFCLS